MNRVTDHAVQRYLQRVEGVDIEGVRRRIAESANKPWIKVTDHAVLRYLRRAEGVDIEGVRRRIAESANKPWIEKLVMFAGSTPFKIKAPNLTCCVTAGVVTTCYPKSTGLRTTATQRLGRRRKHCRTVQWALAADS